MVTRSIRRSRPQRRLPPGGGVPCLITYPGGNSHHALRHSVQVGEQAPGPKDDTADRLLSYIGGDVGDPLDQAVKAAEETAAGRRGALLDYLTREGIVTMPSGIPFR